MEQELAHAKDSGRQRISPRLLWADLAGLSFGLGAFVASWLVVSEAIGDWTPMLYAAPVAAFLCGAVGWAIFFAPGKKVTVLKGAGIGALVGLIAHPLTWYFALLYLYFSGERSSLGEATLNPWEGILASLAYSLLSLLFVGWLTAPIGALVGSVLAYVQSRGTPQRRGKEER